MIRWDCRVEWSSGEEAWVRFNGIRTTGSIEVTGCQEWWDVVGDSYVAVDPKTGVILGCESEDYPHIRNRMPLQPRPGVSQDSLTSSGAHRGE